jgi:hypothetical protein
MHRGEVPAESAGLGRGATFTLVLPIFPSDAEAVAPVATPHAAAASSPLRILVVDDNTDAAHTLALLLETRGHSVVVAQDPEHALESVPLARALMSTSSTSVCGK